MQTKNYDSQTSIIEIKQNFEIRRLMLVVLHTLIPLLALSCFTFLKPVDFQYPLAIIAKNAITISGSIIFIVATMISHIMIRCHYGIVVNGSIINKRLYDQSVVEKLNPLGLSFNFYLLSVLSAFSGLALCLWSTSFLENTTWGKLFLCVFVLLAFTLSFLAHFLTHKSAVSFSEQLTENITYENNSEIMLDHRLMSLEQTTLDIGVVVVTATAIYSATISALAEQGQFESLLLTPNLRENLVTYGAMLISLYGFIVMFFSQRMILRLRIAIGEHASQKDSIIGKSGTQWKATPIERTFMMYTFVVLMATSLLVVYLSLQLNQIAPNIHNIKLSMMFGLTYLLSGLYWYFITLDREGARYYEMEAERASK